MVVINSGTDIIWKRRTIKKQVGLGEKHDYKYKTGEKIKNRDEDGLKSD